MPTISLTLPVSATTITAGLHSANYSTIQTLLNGSLDTSNWAGGKIFAPSKLTQEGATSNQVIQWNGSSWVPATITSSAPNYSTVLPGSPADTTEAFLVDSTTLPTYQWRFRWNNGSSNTDKWEFIGGAPAVVEIATSEATASTSYVALATAGPSFTIPRAGVYLVEIGATAKNNTAADGALMSFDIGGTGAVDGDSISGTDTGTAGPSVSRVMSKSGLAASTALTAKYKATVGGTATFAKRWMRITPIRVS